MASKLKARRGRPPKNPAEKTRKATIYFTPDVGAWLEKVRFDRALPSLGAAASELLAGLARGE